MESVFPWWATVFCKGLESKYFGTVGHPISVTTIFFCHYGMKAAIDTMYMKEHGCSNKNLEKQTMGHIWIIVYQALV